MAIVVTGGAVRQGDPIEGQLPTGAPRCLPAGSVDDTPAPAC